MYAIVRTGGRQQKVSVGDVVETDRITAAVGESTTLAAVLVVDDGQVTSERSALESVAVSAEVVEHYRGKKIDIHLYRNKTGYHRRMGHRSELTRLRITDISTGK
jgi:large subunit ribosomal protein L21